MKNNADDNEEQIEALLFSCKTYNLGSSGTDFLSCVFFTSRRDFKGSIFSLIKQSRVKLWLLLLGFFSRSTCVIVQYALVFYWENFLWRENFHRISHPISVQFVCYNSPIKQSFDNWMYESNPPNSDFDSLPFDGDEILITRRQIYCLNYDIIEKLC